MTPAAAFTIRPWLEDDGVPQEAVEWIHSSTLWVAARGSNAVALVAWRGISDGEYELLYVTTVPAERRKGAARALLSELLRQYPGTWFLEVRESNAAARALYDDLGFELRGRRTRYYSDPDEDGLVMAAVAASTCI